MAYFAPYIDETGLHLPLYQDVLDELNDSCRRIFGNDVYLEPDSQDYQVNAEVADMWADLANLAQLVYNNRSIQFAKGVAVDGLLKINGLKRLNASSSICEVTCSGTQGTVIRNALITDAVGDILWSLEDCVIDANGTADTIATCETPGQIYADAGTLIQIVTQTRGWERVVNHNNAIPGKAIESDQYAKARQAISTARPSLTVLMGLTGGIAEIPGVLRYRAYENDTNTPDSNGVPGHSVCYVVEGGGTEEIGNEIYLRKTPGCGTYGDVRVDIPPPNPALDNPPPIWFFRPIYVDVFVRANIARRAWYVDEMTEEIRNAITDFINSLDIGENVSLSLLEAIAQSVAPNLRAPAFTLSPTLPVLIRTDASTLDEADIEIAFNAAARCAIGNVEVVFV
jgi:uncharacterized phage protein gp47/JayE